MVECQSAGTAQPLQFSSERRVVHSIKKFTNEAQVKCLLVSCAKYSHNQMDGKVSIFPAQSILEGQDASSSLQQLPESQFFQSQTACGDSLIVRDPKDQSKLILVSGFDDGALCLMHLSLLDCKSVHRPIFKTTSDEAKPLDQGIYEGWHEQTFEHHDSIVSVDCNQTGTSAPDCQKLLLLSASKDGTIIVWTLDGDLDDRLVFAADVNIGEPLSRALWLTDSCILATTLEGNLFKVPMGRDSQNAVCLQRPLKIYAQEYGAAIWDLCVNRNPHNLQVWLAEDSGYVTQCSFDSNSLELTDRREVCHFISESALAVSFDTLRRQSGDKATQMLTVGSNSQVKVFKRNDAEDGFSLAETIGNVSDNVACTRTVFVSQKQQLVTLYATYDGRVHAHTLQSSE